MRAWLNLFESTDLDNTLQTIADYVQHNADIDFKATSEALHAIGYQETVALPKLYRALWHDVTAADRAKFQTVGEMFPELQANVRFDLNRAQGFTTSLDKALEFVGNQLTTTHGAPNMWPIHHPDVALSDVRQIIAIYEIEGGEILFSMRGLKAFLKTLPASPGHAALDHALNDLWDGYGGDDEVVVDSAHARITDVGFFDTREYQD